MGLDATVRSAVATAKKSTAALQADIQLAAWISDTARGKPNYAPAVLYPAIVEEKQRKLTDFQGVEVLSTHKVTILRPVVAHGADNRQEPVDARDKLTLPDGTTGPILAVGGMTDPSTGKPYLHEIWLGEARR
jgi:hypothetical protein